MAGIKSALLFVLQSIVVGLAAAFLVVLIRPDLLPVLGGGAGGAPASYADAVDLSAPAVANVYTKRLVEYASEADERPRFRVETGFGSAVVIDPQGFLVTNYHVVMDTAEIRVQLSDGRIAEPRVVGVDAETDLALLMVDLGTLPAVRLGSSGQLRIGDVVLAIGNPYGLTKSVTQGIVSATGRGMLNLTTFENFQTDAAINAGNSGGALINVRGELVGINTAILEQDAGTEGIGFAIPVDLVRGVVAEIKQHGRVVRGWMGFIPDDMTPAERNALGIAGNVGIQTQPAQAMRRGKGSSLWNAIEAVKSGEAGAVVSAGRGPSISVTLLSQKARWPLSSIRSLIGWPAVPVKVLASIVKKNVSSDGQSVKPPM